MSASQKHVVSEKTVLITGAASGLGQAVAEACAAAGANLILLDIQKQAGADLAKSLKADFYHCDVSDISSWQQCLAAVKQPIDFLHLNAGIQIAPPSAPLTDYSFANATLPNYDRMMGVNVNGVVFGLKTCLPLMTSGGSVVATSSMAGIVPYGVDPLYSMSKHAVSGLVRSVAEELAEQSIRINALCPGGLDTEIIPHEQRNPAALMPAASVAAEVMKLFATTISGHTWAKVSAERPAWVIQPPGKDKNSPRITTADISG